MKVKICGLNPKRDVQLCLDLKVDYLGFIFYEKSPRNVNLADIKTLSKYDRKNSAFVAVTVNPSNDFIKKNLVGNFNYIQLHGSESIERLIEIKNMGFKIIKTIKVKEEQDIDKYKEFSKADVILFDTPGMEKSFEFPKNLIKKIPSGDKFALAGSISQYNVKNINKLGIKFFDLSSSLESQLGYKDHHKIKNFINKVYEIEN